MRVPLAAAASAQRRRRCSHPRAPNGCRRVTVHAVSSSPNPILTAQFVLLAAVSFWCAGCRVAWAIAAPIELRLIEIDQVQVIEFGGVFL